MNDSSSHIDLQSQFEFFAKCRELNSDKPSISLLQSDKWMMKAQVIDGKRITTTDTGISFNKLRYLTKWK